MIDAIDVHVTDLPVRLQRTFSSGSYDTGPSGQELGKPVLVKIHADGVTGYGQVRPIAPGHFVADTTHSVVAAIRDIYGPALIGQQLCGLESMNAMFDRRLAGNPAARAVLEMAVIDAMGKACGVPAHTFLGGPCRTRIPLEWSVSLAGDVGAIVAEATMAAEQYGIGILCIKGGDHRGWRQDVRHIEAVRRALGDSIVVGIDPNTGWTVPDALQAVDALRTIGIAYIEQPVDRRDLAGLAEIRQVARGIPVMADESLFTLQDALALASARAVDAYCIKLYKVGGFTTARKMAAIAEAANLLVNCGGLAVQSQLEAAAAAHFCAGVRPDRFFGGAEFTFGLNTVAPDPLVVETDFVIRDGNVEVPTSAGLGVTIDEAALRRYTLRLEHIGRETRR
ncbi:enolase C-terminal domain-like protein [Pigmentiphaga sp.]|uniref:mandelate racemase/muconate lactonizing enzyme family protein n=1 Tax=Pigmentiphaga sp. TaxID=1977564 RepID=UPI0025F30BE7|nr:enolase C-terminal domain-like protein [Pigmentiphaga sp.]